MAIIGREVGTAPKIILLKGIIGTSDFYPPITAICLHFKNVVPLNLYKSHTDIFFYITHKRAAMKYRMFMVVLGGDYQA